MQYYLVSVSGEHKGKVWPMSSVPLSFGRNPECSVMLSAPNVSRRHCQVMLRGEEVLLEDLGSRNLPLVNGRPVRHHILTAGDDLFLGHDHFVLGCVADMSLVGGTGAEPLLDTLNWERMEGPSEGGAAGRIRPRTVQDLAMLYESASEFNGCTDPNALLGVVERRLTDYFNPEAVWIARAQGVVRCSLCGGYNSGKPECEGPSGPTQPQALMDACVHQGRALLEQIGAPDADTGEILRYAAPVMFDGIPLAVLAVCTRTGRDVHPEGGLAFITLLARSLAPALFGADQCAAMIRDNERLRVRVNESHTIVGDSEAMRTLRTTTLQCAKTDISVLITGETGVGKELVARALHDFSRRKEAPLVIVNCAAIPRELFESELFGHVKGAFTGATAEGLGLLVKANGGTLFLDEIGDLSLENQARILRVVENRTFRALGSTREVHVDVRFIAATNKNLGLAVREGRFREDLYHRIRGMEIHVPPLRDHLEDIPALAEHFLIGLRDDNHRTVMGFAPDVFETLRKNPWPGNVRELRNAIHRAITLAQDATIQVRDILSIPAVQTHVADTQIPSVSLGEIEKRHITQTLQQCDGNVRLAAKALGISRTTLYSKINIYGIEL